jgi:DNA-binding XRE family transcriptional regulator
MSSESPAIEQPIRPIAETVDTVTLSRADFDALLEDLEDAEDRIAVLEEHLAIARGDMTPSLTAREAERLLAGESPVRVWRQKFRLTQRRLAAEAGISQSQLAQIEARRKDGSIDTLRRIARVLNVTLDALALPLGNKRAEPLARRR